MEGLCFNSTCLVCNGTGVCVFRCSCTVCVYRYRYRHVRHCVCPYTRSCMPRRHLKEVCTTVFSVKLPSPDPF